jgi:pyruvate,water dikinase
MPRRELVIPFEALGKNDVARVDGKNASLGEMIARLRPRGVRVPDGFATTADAYRDFIAGNDLADAIGATLQRLRTARLLLTKAGAAIRRSS